MKCPLYAQWDWPKKILILFFSLWQENDEKGKKDDPNPFLKNLEQSSQNVK